VKDQLSHVIGIERTLLGDPVPSLEGPVPAHVHNAVGEMNEAWIAARRPRPGEEVLAELRTITARRLAQLRAMTPEEFEVVGWSPVGDVPYREFMEVRVFDCWVHEQDIRQALGRPGGRGGPGEAGVLQRVGDAMGYVVGHNVKPPDGTTVVFDLTGAAQRVVAVEMLGGRGRSVVEAPSDPTVRLRLDSQDFWRLGCGREMAEDLAPDAVVVEGDADLGRRVLGSMNFMF